MDPHIGAKTVTAFKIPLSVIVKWPKPNLVNPNRAPWYTPTTATLHALATIVVATRIWTKVRRGAGGFGIEDSLILGAWLLASALTGLGIYGVEVLGMDRHVWDTPPATAATGGLMVFALEILFLGSLTLTKISVLLFFRRLIDRSYARWIRFTIWAGIVFMVLYFVGFTMFLVFACNPVEASWKSLDRSWKVKYTCVDRAIPDALVGLLSVFSDVFSMAIPVYIVSKLKVQRSKKVILYFVFCCGLVAVGAGIVRTYYLRKLTTDPQRDLTRVGLKGMMWGSVEMELAIICASAPAMKGFLSAVHEQVSTVYSARRYVSPNSQSAEGSGIERGSSDGIDRFKGQGTNDDFHMNSRSADQSSSRWTEKSAAGTVRSSDDVLLNAPEKKLKVQGGILVTETFSVDRQSGFRSGRLRPQRATHR